MTAAPDSFVSHPLEDPMNAHPRTRQTGATGYYLGRPAAFWRTALAPRSAAQKSPCDRALVAGAPAARAASAAK